MFFYFTKNSTEVIFSDFSSPQVCGALHQASGRQEYSPLLSEWEMTESQLRDGNLETKSSARGTTSDRFTAIRSLGSVNLCFLPPLRHNFQLLGESFLVMTLH